jgi:hypothetical protein
MILLSIALVLHTQNELHCQNLIELIMIIIKKKGFHQKDHLTLLLNRIIPKLMKQAQKQWEKSSMIEL